MADIFLSYSRTDQAIARRYAEAFQRAGLSVWWDATLRAGEAYDEVTEEALRSARAVVVLWSTTSVASRWVRAEATQADRNKTLMPAMIEPCTRPIMFELTQTADLAHWTGAPQDPAWLAFLADVRRRVDNVGGAPQAAAPAPIASPPPVPPRGLSRRAVLGGAAVLAIGASAVAVWRSRLLSPAAPQDGSVAVLPFANLSDDPDQAYFSDGLAAEIRGTLSRNRLLQVVGQASSNVFRERKQDAKEISRQLDVIFLLDGSVRRSGDTVRIVTELIDGRTGFSQWSKTFERPLHDVFAVQAEIATVVASALSAELAGGQAPAGQAGKDGPAVGGTEDVAAYDALLRGRELFALGESEATDRAALAKFTQATELDPRFGAAYAATSRALAVIANQYAQGADRRATYDRAVAAAEQAIALAPDLADAHSALAFALFSGRLDIKAARAPYERSNELGAGDADVLGRYALYCARTGRFAEARASITRAATLDPLNPRVYRSMGAVEFAARRYAESIPPVRRALEMNPKMGGARAAIGASQLLLGQVDEARASFAAERSSLFGLPGIAIIAHRQGKKDEAQRALQELVDKNGDNSLYQQAQVYAQWGDSERAMAALLRGQASYDGGLTFLRNDPFVDPLRPLPAFQQLLTALGFA